MADFQATTRRNGGHEFLHLPLRSKVLLVQRSGQICLAWIFVARIGPTEHWHGRKVLHEEGLATQGGYSPYCYDAQFIVGGTIERQVHFV